MATPSHIVLSADIGGSHITAALVDMQAHEIIPESYSRATIDPHGDAQTIFSAWADCMKEAKGAHPVEQVCIAMPGPMDYEKGISFISGLGKYESLYGKSIKEGLSPLLQVLPEQIFTHNDAGCFLQGELFAAKEEENETHAVVGLTLGTGLGSAVFRNGIAHNADIWGLPFKEGMAEDYLSTRWFVNQYHVRTGKHITGVKELVLLAEKDALVQALFHEFADNLASLVNIFAGREAATKLVLGGNIVNAYALFGPRLQSRLAETLPRLTIQVSSLGETAALLGAASCWRSLHKHSGIPSHRS